MADLFMGEMVEALPVEPVTLASPQQWRAKRPDLSAEVPILYGGELRRVRPTFASASCELQRLVSSRWPAENEKQHSSNTLERPPNPAVHDFVDS
jgi:hypothetical protein